MTRSSILSRRPTAELPDHQPEAAEPATARLASPARTLSGAEAELSACRAEERALVARRPELMAQLERVEQRGETAAQVVAAAAVAEQQHRGFFAKIMRLATPAPEAEVERVGAELRAARAAAESAAPTAQAAADARAAIRVELNQLDEELAALRRRMAPLERAVLLDEARARSAASWQQAVAALDALGEAVAAWVAHERITAEIANHGRDNFIGGAPYPQVWTNGGAFELAGPGRGHVVDVEAQVRTVRAGWTSEIRTIVGREG
jgi:chromosome segregation ATPase